MVRRLAKSTLERYQKQLEEEQARLTKLVGEYQKELEEARLTESSSDRSPDPGDPESSSVKMEYAKELSIERNILDLLDKVNHALERITAGEYGICESCGTAIPVERLNVLPYSTLCVVCAAKVS